jgi:hypothetical protein
MEHRRRTVSSALDDEIPVDLEKQPTNFVSGSFDEDIQQYTDYIYNGTFNLGNYIVCGFIKLICNNCCVRCVERFYKSRNSQ